MKELHVQDSLGDDWIVEVVHLREIPRIAVEQVASLERATAESGRFARGCALLMGQCAKSALKRAAKLTENLSDEDAHRVEDLMAIAYVTGYLKGVHEDYERQYNERRAADRSEPVDRAAEKFLELHRKFPKRKVGRLKEEAAGGMVTVRAIEKRLAEWAAEDFCKLVNKEPSSDLLTLLEKAAGMYRVTLQAIHKCLEKRGDPIAYRALSERTTSRSPKSSAND